MVSTLKIPRRLEILSKESYTASNKTNTWDGSRTELQAVKPVGYKERKLGSAVEIDDPDGFTSTHETS